MLMTYDSLRTADLRGNTQADYLVSLDADFQLFDGDRLVYQEPSFPVLELARNLLQWINEPAMADFAFESMSFEEVGSVSVRHTDAGWTFGSVFTPETTSSPVGWEEVSQCIRRFVDRVESDLVALGIDPQKVIRR